MRPISEDYMAIDGGFAVTSNHALVGPILNKKCDGFGKKCERCNEYVLFTTPGKFLAVPRVYLQYTPEHDQNVVAPYLPSGVSGTLLEVVKKVYGQFLVIFPLQKDKTGLQTDLQTEYNQALEREFKNQENLVDGISYPQGPIQSEDSVEVRILVEEMLALAEALPADAGSVLQQIEEPNVIFNFDMDEYMSFVNEDQIGGEDLEMGGNINSHSPKDGRGVAPENTEFLPLENEQLIQSGLIDAFEENEYDDLPL
ncbi:hypothetical protein ABW20_dc0106723 [Dactylellina cionopaga]|nr:hypothetical protein ABW20_dc0106723 [Dactylellina cionopaga]